MGELEFPALPRWPIQGRTGRGMVGISGGDRPVLLGYICRGLLAGDQQVDEVVLAMADFADAIGFCLERTFVEDAVGTPTAFGALVESLGEAGGDAVLLPGLLHMVVLGPQDDIKRLFEWVTGTRVLVL
ncbi:hypothetical protein [Kribbella sp. NPDC051770]|uniref:hypothetical protein n=1 Tax=Kribbella sp. NPDC051770 TaxID=3155413 RepID=UPI00342C0DF3